ncbi:MAG TPA: CopD family protein [Chthoniobacterales bacterium]|nr:CopD family protein [Chthoniobacterales bacterium]
MLDALLIVARSAQIAASILFAGVFTFKVVALGRVGQSAGDAGQALDRQFFWLALWSLVAALFSALLWFWLVVASMSGSSLADALSGNAWQMVLSQTEFGRVWQLRLAVIGLALALVAVGLPRKNSRHALTLALWPLALVLLVSLAWISHAAAARSQPLGLLGDALHLCAAGGWIGGLWPLAIFLKRTGVSVSSGAPALHVLRRFSTLSLCSVGVLVVSGLSNSWLLVGSVAALFTTRYGALLLFKLTLFALLLGFGARNRGIINTAAISPGLLAQLRRNVLYEICLGLAVVAIVGWLGITPPARSGTSAENRTLAISSSR